MATTIKNFSNIFTALNSGKLSSANEEAERLLQETQGQRQPQEQEQESSTSSKPKKKQKPKQKKTEEAKQPSMQSYIQPKNYNIIKAFVEVDEPVLITGEAGTGKNELCKNLAKDLGLDFYFANAVNDPYILTGYGDANGKYQETQFYRFCVNGGLFMFDEIDASDSQVLTTFNSAIANRYFDFPVLGRVELNPNCRFIACANTSGEGASLKYCGRNQLDGATLDRFAIVKLDYDKKVEKLLAKGDEELVAFIEDLRQSALANGFRNITAGYRAIKRIAKVNEILNPEETLKTCLLKSLDKEDIKSLYSLMKVASNKYYDALRKLGGC